jgi:hypothetical protein
MNKDEAINIIEKEILYHKTQNEDYLSKVGISREQQEWFIKGLEQAIFLVRSL